MWLALPLLCTENTAERKLILCSLMKNPSTFTSDCLADTLLRELVVVTQQFLLSLYAEEHCYYRLGCVLGNMTGEKGKIAVLSATVLLFISVLRLLLHGLTITNSSVTGNGNLP